MALIDIINAINGEIIRLGRLPDGTPAQLGSNPKRNKTSPSSVFWVPIQSKGSGPNVSASRSVQDTIGYVPKTIRVRTLSLECHLWAGDLSTTDDYSKTEDLLDTVLTAVNNVLPGGYSYNGEKWVNPGTEAATLGHRCVAFFNFGIPMLEITQPGVAQSVEVKTITPTNQIGPLPPDGQIVTV